ncbi:hypothetical protein FQA39_LY04429 [Lamprigera yunnana]|nr:hypothetical protein FQA39_LY04429 [Lamprigera yunnana]
MIPHKGINASTFYGRRYKDLESAIGDLEDDDRQIDLTIISPSPDYETDLDDIDEDNILSDVLPADVPGEIEVFTNDSEYDCVDNIPLARFQTINSNGQTKRRKIEESELKWTKHVTDITMESTTGYIHRENSVERAKSCSIIPKVFRRPVTCNIQETQNKMEEVIEEMEKIKIHIAALTEMKKKDFELTEIGSYIHISSGVTKEKRASKGVTIMILKNRKQFTYL